MRRDSEHRVSLTRRMRRCGKLLDRLFPLTPANRIHWSHCVNLDTMSVEFTETCPLSQITGTRSFAEACRSVRMRPGDVIWQHAGLMRYNFPGDDRTWRLDWERLEITKLNAALRELILEKRARHPHPKNVSAA